MTDINPFEPWRPRGESERLPERDEDVLKPWTPRGHPPTESTEREPEWYAGPARKPDWSNETREMSPALKWLVAFTILLLLGGLVSLAVLGPNHVPRVAATAAAWWIGLLVALALASSWHWYSRITWVLGGALGAAACWYLVPTTGGINLLEAQRRLDRLQRLAAGDLAGYETQRAEQFELIREFPSWRADIDQADRAWYRRYVNHTIQEAERQCPNDPDRAQAALRNLGVQLRVAGQIDLLGSIDQARRRVFAVQVDRLVAELETMRQKRQYGKLHLHALVRSESLCGNAAELRGGIDLDARVRTVRVRAVRQQADDVRDRLETLLGRKEYEQVAVEGRRLLAELQPVAASLGEDVAVRDRINQMRNKALTARIDAAVASLVATLAKKEYRAVAETGRRCLDELREEAGQLGRQNDLHERLFAPRRQALVARIDQALETLQRLLAKKEFPAVAVQGEEFFRTLQDEALFVREDRRLGEALAVLRRKAVLARLDQARQQVQALLRQDRFVAVGEAGEKTYKELGVEAGNVGLAVEVVRFRDSCRVFADLARKANADDR